MGHAGAIISGGKGSVEDKITALTEVGALVAERPRLVGKLLEKLNVPKR
jgi:succinyl-CoA synthetase alpha subunit